MSTRFLKIIIANSIVFTVLSVFMWLNNSSYGEAFWKLVPNIAFVLSFVCLVISGSRWWWRDEKMDELNVHNELNKVRLLGKMERLCVGEDTEEK